VFNVAAKVVEAAEVVADEKIQTLQLRFANGTKIVAGSSNPGSSAARAGTSGWTRSRSTSAPASW
jgi:phage FluMu gp28-like protein